MSPDIPSWLAEPALSRLWAATRDRLERHHVEPTGRIVLRDLTREERHAIGGLLARAVTTDRVSVDLSELDRVLAERSPFRGLVDAVTAFTGARPRDRRAERSAAAAAREAPIALARELIAADPRLAGLSWAEAWLAGVRRSGLLTRTRDGSETIRRAIDTLARLPVPSSGRTPSQGTTSRVDLAAAVAGDAHALDDGSVLAQLVLRFLALDAEVEPPTSAAPRRTLWERYGVSVDSVSSTCLVLGLRARGPTPRAQRLRLAAEAGDPVHVTAWDLRDIDLEPPHTVLVCENPRVLEAIAQQVGARVAVVCASGQPSLVVLEVLRRLRVAAANLWYHGDFDWPGIAIANRLVQEAGVRPWRMSAADYEAAAARSAAVLELQGRPVGASWDRQLAAAMERRGVVIHEEAVLDEILQGVLALGADDPGGVHAG